MKLKLNIEPSHYVNVLYNTHYDCENNGCNDDGICRCGSIDVWGFDNIDICSDNIEIYGVPTIPITATQPNLHENNNEFDHYLLECLIDIHRLNHESSWEANVESGYYGDEIGEAYCTVPSSMTQAVSTSFTIHKDVDRVYHLFNILGITVDHEITDVDVVDILLENVIISPDMEGEVIHKFSNMSPIGIVDENNNLMTNTSVLLIKNLLEKGKKHGRFIRVS